MKVPDPFKQISKEDCYFFFPEGNPLPLPLFDQFLERPSANELHLDDEMLVGLVKGVEFDYIFMIHGLKYLCLLEESSNSRLVHGLFLDDLCARGGTLTAYSLFSLWS